MDLSTTQLWLFVLLVSVPSFITCWLATFVVRILAPRFGLIDKPNHRKVHIIPTPLGGGVAIWLGVVIPIGIGTFGLLMFNGSDALRSRLPDWLAIHLPGLASRLDSLWILLGCGTVLMVIGLLDDRFQIGWKIRLSIQFIVATFCVVWQGLQLTAFIELPLFTTFLSVFWIVAMINSFNMLDNMDGLSGGVTAIAASVLGAMLLLAPTGSSGPQLFVAGFVFLLAGSVGGFLLHNKPPAKIFMGDAGSYFNGFLLSCATLLATYANYDRPFAVLTPLFIMAVPMYDMTTVIYIRLKLGKSPFEADKNHLSHRLVELGFSKTQAVLTIYLLCATCSLGALLLHRLDWTGCIIASAIVLCTLLLVAVLESTVRSKVRAQQSTAPSSELKSPERPLN